MKKLFLFLSIVIFPVILLSKDSTKTKKVIKKIEEEVKVINSLNLSIFNVPYDGKVLDKLTTDKLKYKSDHPYSSFGRWIFYDRQNRIRRFQEEDTEMNISRSISYYDENGKIILILLKTGTPSDCSINGRIYFFNKKPVKFDAFHGCCKNAQFTDDFESCKNQPPPKESFPYTETTSQLIDKYKLPGAPGIKNFYKPRLPKTGDITFITGNSVIIRNKPSRKGKKVDKLNTLQYVKIQSIEKKEKIMPWGNHNWFKISYGRKMPQKHGYIFGAFVGPVYEK